MSRSATSSTPSAVSKSSEGIFDLPAKESRLALIDEEMAKATFWDDSRKAQAVVQERAAVARLVGRVKDLDTQLQEIRLLWEMGTEAGDESVAEEISQGLARLREDISASIRPSRVSLAGRSKMPSEIVEPLVELGHVTLELA